MKDKYQEIIDHERIELAKKLAKIDRNFKRKLFVLYAVIIILAVIGLILNTI